MAEFEIGKHVMVPATIFVVLVIIGLQLAGLSLESQVSQSYVSFYQNLLILGFVGFISTVIFQIKFGDIITDSRKVKAAIFIAFFLFIVFLSVDRGQIIPVPKASVEELQLDKGTELYTSSVIPGITEDLIYLWVLPTAIALVILMFYEWRIGEAKRLQVLAAILVACFIASTGYNIWLVPGFTSAHVPAYGQTDAYLGAWMFSFGQSLVYMVTGWFLPVSHITHNLMISYGELYQVNAFGFLILGGG